MPMGKSEEQTGTSHTMGLRLDDETYNELEHLSQEMHVKKSALLKTALKRWAIIRMSVNYENMTLIGKPMLKFLMENLSEKQAFEMAALIASNMCSHLANQVLKSEKDITSDSFLKHFIYGMGINGKGWFDKIQLQKISVDKYRIFGTHRFGENFSTFVFHLITNIMKDIQLYETKREMKIKNKNFLSMLIIKKP
jgi:hypothetical protein